MSCLKWFINMTNNTKTLKHNKQNNHTQPLKTKIEKNDNIKQQTTPKIQSIQKTFQTQYASNGANQKPNY